MTKTRKPAILGSLFVLALQPTARAADLLGTVKDVCGRVLPGAVLKLRDDGSSTSRVVTAADGTFAFRSVRSGPHSITVELTGYQPYQRSVWNSDEDGTSTVDVRLRRDFSIKETVTVDHGQRSASLRRYALKGVVVGPDETPISGAAVQLRAAPFGSQDVDVCRTDHSGRYEVTVEAEDGSQWRLSVEADGYAIREVRNLNLLAERPLSLDIQLQRR